MADEALPWRSKTIFMATLENSAEVAAAARSAVASEIYVANFIYRTFGLPAVVHSEEEINHNEEVTNFDHDDGGDVWILNDLVSVKRSTYRFTNLEDFQFAVPIIDNIAPYDRMVKKIKKQPLAYVVVCEETGGMIFLPVAETRNDWVVVSTWNIRRKHYQQTYRAAKRFWRQMGEFGAYYWSRFWIERHG